MPPSDQDPLSAKAQDRYFDTLEKHLQKDLKLIKEFRKVTEDIKKNMLEAMGVDKPGGGKMGLGTLPNRGTTAALAIGAAAYGGAKVFMGMAPNTMAAVTQRMSADATAGISGLNARQVILRSNRMVGNGATSAMGPTMANMNLLYGGGYTATSLSSRNIMSQIGGLSAITGGTNEQMAQGLAGINAMRFLRIGVQARDSKGNLRPPNQIINDTYRFLYGGRKITAEQAAMVLNPGSKGYQTIAAIAGGDQNLMQILQMGVIARAKKDSPLTKKDLGNAQTSLDIMGVGKESPIRRLFGYNTSEARKLQATEKGLVGGYNTALSATTAVNNGFSSVAEAAAGVTQALMGLKGFLETLPGAGNTGATLSGLAGNAMGMGSKVLEFALLSRLLGGAGGAGAAGGGLAGKAGLAGLAGLGGKLFKGGVGSLSKAGIKGALGKTAGKFIPGLGAVISGVGGYQRAKAGGGFWGGLASAGATGAVAGGVTGAFAGGVGAIPGAALGALGSMAGYGLGYLFGQGGDGCAHGNIGAHNCGGMGGGDPQGPSNLANQGVLQMPVPKGTKITSPFGPRDNSKNPQISKNHSGIDYAVPVGTPVWAAGAGEVSETGNHRQYGYYVIIRHGSRSTLYGHLSKILVKRGQQVSAGQTIGLSGGKRGAAGAGSSTGPHLHFELRSNGSVGAQGRVNPQNFFGKAGSFISNLFKRSITFFKKVANKFGANFSYSDKNPDEAAFNFNDAKNDRTKKFLSDYSSASISSMVSALNYHPTDRTELGRYINTKDPKFKGALDDTHTLGYQGEKGILGGSREALINALYAQGFRGKALKTAFAVALAESGGRPSAVGDKHLVDKKWGPSYGIFQIRSLNNWKNYDGKGSSDKWRDASKLATDPKFQIQAAWIKSKHGNNWKGWSTYTSGAFTKYLDDADRAASSAGVGGGDPVTETGSSQPMTRASSRSLGGNSTANVNIKVDMQVVLQNGGTSDAEKLLRIFKDRLETELETKGLGAF